MNPFLVLIACSEGHHADEERERSSARLLSVLTVGPNGTYATVGDALTVAVDGDRIEVEAGVYDEALVIHSSVTLTGAPGATLVSTTADPIVEVDGDDVTIAGFEIACDRQQGIWAQDRVNRIVLADLFVHGCHAGVGNSGGALESHADVTIVRGSRFAHNRASHDGAALEVSLGNGDLLDVTDSRFEDNDATMFGGAISAGYHGTVRITRSQFVRNGWSAVALHGVDLVVRDSTFIGNEATIGSAIDAAETTSADVRGSRFCRNTSGPALRVTPPPMGSVDVAIARNVFLDNDGGQSAGGGLTVNALGTTATGWIVDNTFVANTARFGSHLYAPTLTGTLANNLFVSARGGGAGVEVAATVVSDHNGWFDNGTDLAGTTFGASEVFGDPLFAGWVDDDDCTNDDLTLLPGSPAIDAGDPAFPERDGTPGDLGAG